MSMRRILVEEHLPYVLPIVFSTTMNNINWSIGFEVTLSVLGFTDINTPTVGVLIYWANQHTALVAGIWWWIFFPGAAGDPDLHRPLPAGGVDERAHRPAQPPRPERRMSAPVLKSRACAPTTAPSAFGIAARCARSTTSTLRVEAGEIYGLAGESSCGKTTLIKTIANAIQPPLEVLAGSVVFNFKDRGSTCMAPAARSCATSAGSG
jgi:hypothetical protein